MLFYPLCIYRMLQRVYGIRYAPTNYIAHSQIESHIFFNFFFLLKNFSSRQKNKKNASIYLCINIKRLYFKAALSMEVLINLFKISFLQKMIGRVLVSDSVKLTIPRQTSLGPMKVKLADF